MEWVGRVSMLIGLSFLVVGVLLYLGPSIPWLGRLPGDLRIKCEGLRIYFPIVTCLLASAAVSLIWWLNARWR